MAKGEKSFGNMTDGLSSGTEQGEKTEAAGAAEQNKSNRQGKVTRPTTKSGLVQRAYYITPQQYIEIKRVALENYTDASTIVRTAIDKYLAER